MRTYFTYYAVVLYTITLFFPKVINAQTAFWSEDFANGIPADWGNFDPTGSGGVWMHDPTEGNAPIWITQSAFMSSTAANGFAFMNSDAIGALPVPHEVSLTTSAIDCSNQPIVVVRFQTYAGSYSSDFDIQLGVSTDNINFTYTSVLPNLAAGSFTNNPELIELDISADAADSSEVYLRFRFIGNYEYGWNIDDIELVDQLPLNTTSIDDLYYLIPNNYATPSSQVEDIYLGARVSNDGANTLTNVTLETSVDFDNGSGASNVYSDISSIDTLVTTEDSLLINTTSLSPSSVEGRYTTTYTLYHDNTESTPGDNTIIYDNIVTQDYFCKGKVDANDLPVITGGNADADGLPYEWGTMYHIVNGGYLAEEATFAASPGSGPTLNGVTINIRLYKWVDLNGDFSVENNELTEVGHNNHTYTTELNFEPVTVDILDNVTLTKGVLLEADTDYMLSFGYAGPSMVLCAVGESLPYAAAVDVSTNNSDVRLIAPVKVSGVWNSRGFGVEVYPALKLKIALGTSVEQHQLRKGIKLSIIENPVKNVLMARLELEKMSKNVVYKISDISGKILFRTVRSNVQFENFTYDISDFTAGNYQLTVKTAQGISTKQFIVAR